MPKTSDELLKAIAATTDANAGRFGYGAPTNEHPNVFVEIGTWVTGEGASLFKGDQYNFTDPAVIRAIDKFRTAVKSAPKGTSSEQARQLFVDGKIAMIRDGPWVAAQLKKAPDATRASLKMGMMPFATIPGGTSNSLHMPAKLDPEKRKLVWEFIRMTTTPEWQAKFTLLTSSPAPRRMRCRGRARRAPGSRADQQGRRGGGQPVPGERRRCARTTTSSPRCSWRRA